MKNVAIRLFPIAALALICLSIGGCGGGPKKTAKIFLEDLASQKYAEAKQYATAEAAVKLDMAAGLAQAFGGLNQCKAQTNIQVVNEKVDGDNATVSFRAAENGEAQQIHLQKVNGKWLVTSEGL